jgi:hypothetical protein
MLSWLRNTLVVASLLIGGGYLLALTWAIAPLLLYWQFSFSLALILIGLFAVPIMLMLFVPKPTAAPRWSAETTAPVWTPTLWGGVAGWLALFVTCVWFGPSRFRSGMTILDLQVAFTLYIVCLLVAAIRWALRKRVTA